jgi:hypothetical protein
MTLRDEQDPMETSRSNLSHHILPTSATMVGVCMTVISIIKLVGTRAFPYIDHLLAIASLLFLLSAAFSYYAIRHENEFRLSASVENIADIVFMSGLAIMTIVVFTLVYKIT